MKAKRLKVLANLLDEGLNGLSKVRVVMWTGICSSDAVGFYVEYRSTTKAGTIVPLNEARKILEEWSGVLIPHSF